MGTVPHHQASAARYLEHAQDNIVDGDLNRAARALARAASHTATALAVHHQAKHYSRRQLQFVLQCCVNGGQLSRSHFKTFREICDLPSGFLSEQAKDAEDKSCLLTLRRLRRRADAFA